MRELQKRHSRRRIPFRACQADPRFSFCLYVPEKHLAQQDGITAPLVVVVHGSARTAESFRDAFIEFAERTGCVILAPLFPQLAAGPDDLDGYKLEPPLGYPYDKTLLAMVAEVAENFATESRFSLFGFSGGAQFAHRFWYLHPEKLTALSVAAPGKVNLPVSGDPFWDEVAGKVCGRLDRLRDVPVQLIIGSDDVGSSPLLSGTNVQDRRPQLESLHDTLVANLIDVRLDLVHGVGHDGFSLLPAAQRFLARCFGGK